ncbi:MAG TPA: cytochrome b/b6 domain-containing protein [Prolixibacteraceae bacterium]|nr:cytochrome b/b6 domain-containing protein [Prolixibacteraceae bacterium]
MGSTEKIYFYPVWLRIWHGINALGIIVLIITGLSMQSSLEKPLLGFNMAVNIHNIAGVIVTLSYLVYFVGNIVSGNGRYYLIKLKGFIKRMVKQSYYYSWGMFHGMDYPFPLSEKRKFNPLQQFIYVVIMYLFVPVVIITGFALLFPETIIENVYGLSGVFVTAVLHSAMGFFISIFLIIHLFVASIGKSPVENFKSMITGWHHI